jgi:hypothetical protein
MDGHLLQLLSDIAVKPGFDYRTIGQSQSRPMPNAHGTDPAMGAPASQTGKWRS